MEFFLFDIFFLPGREFNVFRYQRDRGPFQREQLTNEDKNGSCTDP